MIRELKRHYLHEYSRHTNLIKPGSMYSIEYIKDDKKLNFGDTDLQDETAVGGYTFDDKIFPDGTPNPEIEPDEVTKDGEDYDLNIDSLINSFPKQNTELLNTEVTLQYRNRNHWEDVEVLDYPATIKDESGRLIPSRPEDDEEFQDRSGEGPDYEDDYDYIHTGVFRIVRADVEKPYTLIAVKDDYTAVVVSSSEPIDGGYKFQSIISVYNLQREDLLAVRTVQIYDEKSYAEPRELPEGVVFRVDSVDPNRSVIMELLPAKYGTRLVRFVTGDEVLSDIIMKTDDTFAKYNDINVITEDDIVLFRSQALEGKQIYGTA